MLKPVPQSKLAILDPIFAARIAEAKLSERVDLDYLKKVIVEGYTSHSKAAWVDDIENPKHCVICGFFQAAITREKTVGVHLFYSAPEVRGDMRALKDKMDVIEIYARSVGADAILGSSWLYGESEQMDSIWERSGYVPQAKTFVKLLNHG